MKFRCEAELVHLGFTFEGGNTFTLQVSLEFRAGEITQPSCNGAFAFGVPAFHISFTITCKVDSKRETPATNQDGLANPQV